MKPSREKQSKQKQRLQNLFRDRERRVRLLLDRGMISGRWQIPDDAIPVDPDESTKARTWNPVLYYRDIQFVCCDCSSPECWSTLSQQHYFEILKASPYKLPNRCYPCRQRELQRKNEARRAAGHKPDKTNPTTEPPSKL
jgi:hypothetical protein